MEHIDNLRSKLDDIREAMTPEVFDADPYFRGTVALLEGLPTERSGTMRKWFEGRTMTEVGTLQISRTGRPWAPGPRMVESRATMVRLDGSVREFKGCTVLGASEGVLVVHADPAGFDQVIIYWAV